MRVTREDVAVVAASVMLAVGGSLTVATYLMWWAEILAALG